MSTAKLTFHSALWNHGGRILEYLLMYITSIVIARSLGVQENGRFVGLFSLSHLILVFCSFGLETSLNKFIPQLTHEQNKEKTTSILRTTLLIRLSGFIGIAGLFYMAIRLVTIPFLERSSDVLLIVLLFTGARSLFPLFAMVLTAQLRTPLTARINLAIRSVEFVAILVLTQFQFTIQGLFIIFLCTSLLHVTAFALFSRMNFFGERMPVDMKPIVTFGGIYWVNTIVDFVLGRQGDVLFLTNLLPDLSQGGLYDVAYSIAQLASMAMTVGLSGVMFATFARLAVSDQATMNKFYSFSIRMISLLTLPLYTFLIFNAEAVVAALYSSQYLLAVPLVQGILVFRIVSRLFGGPENAEYLLSNGRVGALVTVGVVSAMVNVSLNLLLIPKLGAMGSVLASGFGNLLVNVLGALMVCRVSTNRIQFLFWGKLTAGCFVVALVCAYFIPATHASSLVASALLYVLLLLLVLMVVKPLTAADHAWLSRIDDRLANVLQRFTRPELRAVQ